MFRPLSRFVCGLPLGGEFLDVGLRNLPHVKQELLGFVPDFKVSRDVGFCHIEPPHQLVQLQCVNPVFVSPQQFEVPGSGLLSLL